MDGDDASKIARRLFRNERNIKDPKSVTLYRHEDPVLGPRKIPNLEKPLDGKVAILADQVQILSIHFGRIFLDKFLPNVEDDN
jgi:hypothetical protein